MAYRVEITRRALRDLTGIYSRIEAETWAQAARWFDGMERAIN
jgi:plasmid stabilization system protein ParE